MGRAASDRKDARESSRAGKTAGKGRDRVAPRIQAGHVAVLGAVWVELGPRGELIRLLLPGLDPRQPKVPAGAEPLDAVIERALTRYVEGSPRDMQQLRLERAPSAFAQAVREAMCAVPWGAVATYGELAERIGKPGAARAVGRACATNPVPVVVPCHRVVASGGPGGFGLGMKAKRTLLALEGVDLDQWPARTMEPRKASTAETRNKRRVAVHARRR